MRMWMLVLAGLLQSVLSFGQDPKWILMGRAGTAYNFKTPLVIRQNEFEDIRFRAEYATRPFAPPPYWDLHFVKWNKTKGWALKVTHHKLYLQNNPPEIQRFTITDGYNLVTLVRQWQVGGFIYHLGGGAVFTHPESVIRGRRFSETKGVLHSGYHLSGPVAEAAIEKRIDLSYRLMLSLEGRVTASFVRVPVAGGHAYASNIAVHGLAGIGYKIYGNQD